MRHVGDVIECVVVDVAQREHKIVGLGRQLRHVKTVGRMDISYRVDAKLLRLHDRISASADTIANARNFSNWQPAYEPGHRQFPVAVGPALS